ncbi:patatin-like phospholipase family protein [Nocardia pseudovaccinii]|uniref:patatin-like phospholipase family protein n=1 Tax=Nocardia pseudovaccinii TaxID=189540 RepID=UPI0007A51AB8|nr:patatin-like phospholipase family protein [Nocardia pseudovaccinii]
MRTEESRAVVLGPGGVVGTAWLIGFLHGLRRAGVDLAEADTIAGTSAGAIAAVVLTSGRDLAALATRAAQPESEPSEGDPEVVGKALALARAAGNDPEETRRDEAPTSPTVPGGRPVSRPARPRPLRWPQRSSMSGRRACGGKPQ